jgi:hypothetical protein
LINIFLEDQKLIKKSDLLEQKDLKIWTKIEDHHYHLLPLLSLLNLVINSEKNCLMYYNY